MNTKTIAYLKLLEVLRDLRATEAERDNALKELKKLQDEYEDISEREL